MCCSKFAWKEPERDGTAVLTRHHRSTQRAVVVLAARPFPLDCPSALLQNLPAAIKVDKENMDYNKLRVKQLKGILADRGVDCNGCLEKSDYVARCKATEHLEL